jgi:hypothetical protein
MADSPNLFAYAGDDDNSIVSGYLLNAENILNSAGGKNDFLPSEDCLVYPFVFSLRHAVELTLKLTLTSIHLFQNNTSDLSSFNKKLLTHSIKNLYEHLQNNLRSFKCKPEILTSLLDANTLEWYIKNDDTAESFRYSKNKKGKRILEFAVLKVDAKNLYQTAELFCQKCSRFRSWLVESEEFLAYSVKDLKEIDQNLNLLRNVLEYLKISGKKNTTVNYEQPNGAKIEYDDKVIEIYRILNAEQKENVAKKFSNKDLFNATLGYYFGRNGYLDEGLLTENMETVLQEKLFTIDIGKIFRNLSRGFEFLQAIKERQICFPNETREIVKA